MSQLQTLDDLEIPQEEFLALPVATRWAIVRGMVSEQVARVYRVIVDYIDHMAEGAWPAMQTIADQLGVCRHTVLRATQALRKVGLLVMERRLYRDPDGKWLQTSSIYRLPWSHRSNTPSHRSTYEVTTNTTTREVEVERGSLFGSAEKRDPASGGLQGDAKAKTQVPGDTPNLPAPPVEKAPPPTVREDAADDLDRSRRGMARLARREADAALVVDTFEQTRKATMTRPRNLSAKKRSNALVSARVLLGEHRCRDVLALLTWALERHDVSTLSLLRSNWDEWSVELVAGKIRTSEDIEAEIARSPYRFTRADIEAYVKERWGVCPV